MLNAKELKKMYYVSNALLHAEYVQWYANMKLAQEEGIEEPDIPPYIVESMMKIATRLSYKPNFINYSFKDELIGDALYDCVRFANKFDPNKLLFKVIWSPLSGKISIKEDVFGETSGHTGKVKYISSSTGKVSIEMYQDTDFLLGETITSINGKAKIEEIVTHVADNPFAYLTTVCFRAFLRRIDKEKVQSYVKAKIVSDSPCSDFLEHQNHEDDAEFRNMYIAFLQEAGNSDSHIPMSIKRAKIKKELKLFEAEIEGPFSELESE